MFNRILSLAFVALAAATPLPRAPCADVTVIFARGTTELPLIGTIVGPPLEAALISALGPKTLNFVGVDYAASIAGFLVGGDPIGAATMAKDVTSALGACPNTEMVMSGYRYISESFIVREKIELTPLNNTVKEDSLSICLQLNSPPTFSKKSRRSSSSVIRITVKFSPEISMPLRRLSVPLGTTSVLEATSFFHLT